MKQHEFEIAGRINNDGRLSMYMQELNGFTKKWKNSRIIAIFKVYEPGTSEALKGYYYNCVVPAFQRALWESGDRMTKEKTEEYLRRMSPVMHEENVDINSGRYVSKIKTIQEIDNSEMIEYIDHLKQIGAEEFGIYIEDPNTI